MLDRLINVAISALLGAFLFAFCILVWSASSCEPPSKKQNADAANAADQISCEAFNIRFFKKSGILIARHSTETAAAATAAATAVIAWFTIILSRIGRRQARDSRAVQQAHVFPVMPQHQLLMRQDGTIFALRLWMPWKNSGTTPAVPMTSLVGATWVPDEADFQFGLVDQGQVPQPLILGPAAEIPSGTIDITSPHINALFDHRGHQFFWGRARYRDIFPGTPWHVVEFCFRVTAEGQLGLAGTPPPLIGFAFAGPHNRYYDEPA
jgi:hypothetical protein